MKLPARGLALLVVFQALLLLADPALAQNWSFDARNIGMGGVGSTSNVAVDMVDEQRPYRAIVLPFGLLQVIPNFPKMNPTSDEFDLVRTIEYVISPIHYIVGRDDTGTANVFMTDLRNGELSRNLNDYRGFSPDTSVTAEGLASPSWGYTFKFRKSDDGRFQGIYLGAGPYLSVNTSAEIDPALAAVFASPTPVSITPNTSFYMTNDTESQVALSITTGYRARYAWGGTSGPAAGANPAANGLYVGANLHILRGFIYEHFEPDARLDTNAQGQLFVDLSKGVPVNILRTNASNGTGFAIDAGMAAVIDHWQLGFGVNGLANRMNWTSVERTNYVLDSLFNGGEFVDLPTVPVDDVRVELPVDVRANASYNTDLWTLMTEYGHGYNGTTFRSGVEKRFERVELRGGGRLANERWEGTGGVGYNFTPNFAVDLGLFSTSANLEQKRNLAIAVSLRLMRRRA